MNSKVKKVLEYEPSLDEVKKKALILNVMSQVHITSKYVDELEISQINKFYASIDLLVRIDYAYKILKHKIDLKTIATLEADVVKRWKEGLPEVTWDCEGFLGFRT